MTKEWDDVKEEIRKLYKTENKTLVEVMRLMKGKHGFHASIRSYRTQLRKWGYMKYNTESFYVHRPRELRSTRAGLPASHGLRPSSSTTSATVTNQWTNFDLSSMPIPSETYSQVTEPWQFQTTVDSVAGPSSNHYPTFSPALAGISLHPQDEHGLSLNAQDNDGRTQLHRAAIDGSEELVQKLLTSGAAVNMKDHANNQPLHYAILGNFVEIVELLLKFGADFDSKGENGRSPLHMSVPYKGILEAVLKRPASVSCQDEKGDTPLHLAISPNTTRSNPSLTVIPLLLDAGADINAANMAGVTPFQMIVGQTAHGNGWPGNHLALFFDFGPDISLLTRENRLPFEVFLEKSKDSWTNQWNKNNSSFKLFLNKGVNLDIQLRSGKVLPHDFLYQLLHTPGGDFELAKRLCKAGNPSKIDAKGDYLLHKVLANYSEIHGKPSAMATLLKIVLRQGANPNELNLSGEPPLMVLLTSKYTDGVVEAVKLLLAGGADPMLRDLLGNLPIYEAVRNFPGCSQELGKALLLAEIKINDDVRKSRNNHGATDDQLWWQEWELVSDSGTWDVARERLCNSQGSLPADVGKQICIIALGILAARYLQMAKDRYTAENFTLEEHRSHMAGILRDCRKLEVEVSAGWIDYVLDLCVS